ncbi:DUF6338 family protein [Alicyclobacillus fastidiosus]|uniref:DUF6338 family protein n=1 Tax=Alicyclobacillus fastidiosus TaxID=392011 RepID=A0ABV5AMH5_9BACL
MNSLIATIIVVLPGFVAMMIVESIGPGTERTLSDFERTLYGALFNVPIAILTWVILSIIQEKPITSFLTLHSLLMNIPFDIVYALGQLGLAWFIAYKWVFTWREKMEKFVNSIRKRRNLPSINHQAPYDDFFANSREPIIEIYDLKNGGRLMHRGIFHRASSVTASKLMILTEDDPRLPWMDIVTIKPTKKLVIVSDGTELRKYEAVDLRTAILNYSQTEANEEVAVTIHD